MRPYHFVPDTTPRLTYVLRFIVRGAKRVLKDKKLASAFVLCLFLGYFLSGHIYINAGAFSLILSSFYSFLIRLLFFPLSIIALFFLGAPSGYLSIMRQMPRIGLANAEQECPVLISRRPKEPLGRVEIWEFESAGIPFSAWSDSFEAIENALDIAVVSAEQGSDGRKVLLTVVNHPGPWPTVLPWHNSLLLSKPTVLLLGENRGEKITLDLSKVPHVSISGRTGSGKSVLQQNLMLQCALKSYQIILIDYKGGVDYATWNGRIPILTDDENVKLVLKNLVKEQKKRYTLLREARCANIDEYNIRNPETPLIRICLFVDELTECLDKTGASKERKENITEIADALSSLARLSRAAGIHMILAQQRGSADILPGSVRNNVYKVCGQCDPNLSMLALGTTDAAKRIPPTAKGRFLTEEGTMFQGYYSKITEEMLQNIMFSKSFNIGI